MNQPAKKKKNYLDSTHAKYLLKNRKKVFCLFNDGLLRSPTTLLLLADLF